MTDIPAHLLARARARREARGKAETSVEDGGSLQARAAAWHKKRFPGAERSWVCMKSTEELGELHSAVLVDIAGDYVPKDPGDAPGEAADVMICLLALLGRWYPGHDLLDEVEKKLAILNDPNGTHRASIGAAK